MGGTFLGVRIVRVTVSWGTTTWPLGVWSRDCRLWRSRCLQFRVQDGFGIRVDFRGLASIQSGKQFQTYSPNFDGTAPCCALLFDEYVYVSAKEAEAPAKNDKGLGFRG